MKVYFRESRELATARTVVFDASYPFATVLEVEMSGEELADFLRVEKEWDAWQDTIAERGELRMWSDQGDGARVAT
jgi:hypothetical protein